MEIRTERLVLRPPRADDLAAVVAACQDDDIRRFIPHVPEPYTEADGRAFLETVTRDWEEAEDRTFAITLAGDDTLVGAVTVRLRDGGTVGYWLSPSARGRGLMAEAVRAVARWAREDMGVGRLFLWTHPDNLASQAVAEQSGFVRLGLAQHDPPFRDGTTTGVKFELAS